MLELFVLLSIKHAVADLMLQSMKYNPGSKKKSEYPLGGQWHYLDHSALTFCVFIFFVLTCGTLQNTLLQRRRTRGTSGELGQRADYSVESRALQSGAAAPRRSGVQQRSGVVTPNLDLQSTDSPTPDRNLLLIAFSHVRRTPDPM